MKRSTFIAASLAAFALPLAALAQTAATDWPQKPISMVVPAGTPQPIVDKLQKAIAKVAADPEVIERFKVQGVEIRGSTQAEFKDFLNKEEKRWVTLIKEQNIKPE